MWAAKPGISRSQEAAKIFAIVCALALSPLLILMRVVAIGFTLIVCVIGLAYVKAAKRAH